MIALGTIVAAGAIFALGPRHWLVLALFGAAVWTAPRLVLAARCGVRFSVWRFLVCWVLVPTLLGGLIFYTSAMIQYGGPFAQARLYGWPAWTRSVAIAVFQGLMVAFAIGTMVRGVTEAVLLALPAWRQRVERVWPLLLIIGVTIAVFIRYS